VLIVAGVFATVLATRVFVAFDPLRVRLVEAPVADSGGRVRVRAIDARVKELDPPIAVIARIQHGAPQKQQFSIRRNGGELCSVRVAGGAARRVDCVLAGAPLRPGELELTVVGPAPWTLNYLELATHHGNSSGAVTAYVLPAASNAYIRPHAAWAMALALALTALLLLPRELPRSRALVLTSRALAALALAFAALVLVAPAFSPYRIVLSPQTFASAVTLLLLPLAARLVRAIREWLTERRLAGALAAGVFAFGLISGSRALGAADTYGYVSQAELWLRGNLKIDQSFALQAPWPEPASTFAPLGYRPHPLDETKIVPIYSPGLPMMMALAKWLGGQNAMFAIVPLLGALLVLATYGIGSRLGSVSVGLVGAWLIATSPIVLGHVTIAMSDVPVAAVWSAAIYMLLGEGKRSAVTAGLLSGAAILIRPNLAPLAAILALYYVLRIVRGADRRAHRSELVMFCAATLPGVAAVAMIHASLFGSPLSSGYGPLSELFAWSRVGPNVSNYVSWLVEAHTPIVLIGFAAIFFPLRGLWPGVRDRGVFFMFGAFVIVLWAVYCAWLVFDSWWFGRFMLSSVPFATLGIGAVAVALARLPIPFIRPFVACLVVALGLVQLRFASKNGVFGIPDLERRNVAIAQLAAEVTESNSVVLSGIHSGSLRYYAGRLTLNYTLLDPAWLDGAVEWLSQHGAHPYLMIEDWERADFERRFAGSRSLEALERSAAGIYENPGKATIVDLAPREGRGQTTVVASGTDIGWRAVEPAPPSRLRQSP
jgi:hypothetical protein